jgi:hypothetical protein
MLKERGRRAQHLEFGQTQLLLLPPFMVMIAAATSRGRTAPRRSLGPRMFAVATASWMATLIPTTPTDAITRTEGAW